MASSHGHRTLHSGKINRRGQAGPLAWQELHPENMTRRPSYSRSGILGPDRLRRGR
jgi:hypothetical protein